MALQARRVGRDDGAEQHDDPRDVDPQQHDRHRREGTVDGGVARNRADVPGQQALRELESEGPEGTAGQRVVDVAAGPAPSDGGRRGRGVRIPAVDAPGQTGVWGSGDGMDDIPVAMPTMGPASATIAPLRAADDSVHIGNEGTFEEAVQAVVGAIEALGALDPIGAIGAAAATGLTAAPRINATSGSSAFADSVPPWAGSATRTTVSTASSSTSRTGSSTVAVVPTPAVLRSAIEPPINSISRREIARPRPEPP